MDAKRGRCHLPDDIFGFSLKSATNDKGVSSDLGNKREVETHPEDSGAPSDATQALWWKRTPYQGNRICVITQERSIWGNFPTRFWGFEEGRSIRRHDTWGDGLITPLHRKGAECGISSPEDSGRPKG